MTSIIPGLVEDAEVANALVVTLMGAYDLYPVKTAEGYRNAVLEGMIAFSPALDLPDTESGRDAVNMTVSVLQNIVAEGRMVDFGFLPNAVLRETSLRTRPAFEANELQHPYDDWIAVSPWEGGYCGYYIHVTDEGRNVMCVETYAIAPPGMVPSIVINDLCEIKTVDGETRIKPMRTVIPEMNTEKNQNERCANMLDPLVTFLRFLSDASTVITDVVPSLKLNKARAAKGHRLIPSHTRVETRDYVSNFQAVVAKLRNEGKELTHHNSPVPHWRRAHKRHLASGNVVPVRSTKVNWRGPEELHRLFYRAKVTP